MGQGGQSKMPSNGTANDGLTLILDYLRKHNRPYSATDVSANLHNKVTKSHAAKVLRDLYQKKEIEGRISGKQMVYHSLQNASDETTLKAAVLLDNKLQQLQGQLTGLKAYAKRTRGELTTVCTTPLPSNIRQIINQLEQERETIIAKMVQVQGVNVAHVKKEDQVDTKKEWRRWRKRVNTRRRICHDLWRGCLEVVDEDMSGEEFWESLGLEGPSLIH
ncbi:Tat binding protein 1-interacting protein-domain-containing protein [Aspergillus coremiiformis]|uniref:Tat binding protein 1-interacting protein-domain-containing protein n=1 Tax=Aspergillus coremiiformis TaxID=138285 RepID=A0A5N6YTY1_9EURO|nr:Tat binding protein 1-interacting protein-domain-containing protein [Aspergillus coremiiformis]